MGNSAIKDARLKLTEANIVSLNVEAIVNAANSALRGGGGVDGAIHQAAGPELLAACRLLGGCAPGEAVATEGFQLRAKWVIHAVGPIWHGGDRGEEWLLRSAYRTSLKLAQNNRCTSVAFPAISCGAYGYPVEQAALVAVSEVAQFLAMNKLPHEVLLCCFDPLTLRAYQGAFYSSFEANG